MIVNGSAEEYLDKTIKNDTAWFIDVNYDDYTIRTVEVKVSKMGTFNDYISGQQVEVAYVLVIECNTEQPHLCKITPGMIPTLYADEPSANTAAIIIKLMGI